MRGMAGNVSNLTIEPRMGAAEGLHGGGGGGGGATPGSPSRPRVDSSGAPLEGEELKAAVMRQVEYYLSRENLARDTYLTNQMNVEAFAPINLIASFSKMKSFTTDADLILEAIKMSEKLEVDETETLVRPLDMAAEANRKSMVVLRDVDSDVAEQEIRALFDEAIFGPIERVRPDIGDTWFVELEGEINTEEQLNALDKIRTLEIRGRLVRARVKTESSVRGIAAASFAPSSPTSPGSPLGSPNSMAAAAQYGYPYQPYGFYPGAPMYYSMPPGAGGAAGAAGAPPGQWVYAGWDPAQAAAMGQAGYGGPQPMPGGRGGARGSGGRGSGRGGSRGVGRGGKGSGGGGSSAVHHAGGSTSSGATMLGGPGGGGASGAAKKGARKTGGPASAKSPTKKDAAAGSAVKPESLELSSAMDFPSLPSTPTRGGGREDGEAGEPAPAPATRPAFSGWAAVARKEPSAAPTSTSDAAPAPAPAPAPTPAPTPASTPAPPVTELERSIEAPPIGAAASAGGSVADAGTESASSAPAPAPVPVPEPEPTQPAADAEPASTAPKSFSWAQMAKSKASAPVRPAAAKSSAGSGQQVLSSGGSSRSMVSPRSPEGKAGAGGGDGSGGGSAWGGKNTDAPAPKEIDMWNDGGEETMPRAGSHEPGSASSPDTAPAKTSSPVRKSWADMAKSRERSAGTD